MHVVFDTTEILKRNIICSFLQILCIAQEKSVNFCINSKSTSLVPITF